MEALIELGIFDDNDVLPTQMVMLVELPDDWYDCDAETHGLWLALQELRSLGEKEYGRKVPDSACFWLAHPKPEEG